MSNWGGYRKGSGRLPLKEKDKKKGIKVYVTDNIRESIEEYGTGDNLSDKVNELISSELKNRKNNL